MCGSTGATGVSPEKSVFCQIKEPPKSLFGTRYQKLTSRIS